MTEGGHGHAPLTPDEEAAVARMLADAGGPVRMPDDVVARLEGVLAGLDEERSTVAGAEVVELRKRRRWPRMLLAAAAVVVGGYAVGTVATQGSLSGSDEASSAASDSGEGQDGSAMGDRPGASSEQEDSGGGVTAKEEPNALSVPESGSDTMVLRTVRLRSDDLDTGVRRAVQLLGTGSRRTDLAQSQDTPGSTCPAPSLGKRDRLLPVRYDGEAAVLVAGPERRGTVEVTVWSCAGDELASTLVRP